MSTAFGVVTLPSNVTCNHLTVYFNSSTLIQNNVSTCTSHSFNIRLTSQKKHGFASLHTLVDRVTHDQLIVSLWVWHVLHVSAELKAIHFTSIAYNTSEEMT